MAYNITLLPDTQESKYQVMAQAGEASHHIISHLLANPTADKTHELLLVGDLLSARYWGTLDTLDGPSPERFYQSCTAADFERVKPARVEAQKWATDRFPAYELEKLLNITVNQALLQPLKTCKPGTTIGHANIYDQLVFNSYSLFKDALTPELKERLNNGRFWECIPQTESALFLKIVGDSLNEGELSLDFIPYGIKLMNAANENRPIHDLRLELLEDATLEKYISFMERISLSGVMGKELYPLVREGVSALVRWDHCEEAPYVNNFEKQLRRPFVQEYLSASPELRCDLAIEVKRNQVGGVPSHFKERIVTAVPNGTAFAKLLEQRD